MGAKIQSPTDKFLFELYRGCRSHTPEDFRAGVLDSLQKILRFDSAMWGTSSDSPRRMHEVYVHGQPPAMLENYSRFEDQDFLRTAVCAESGRTINLADLVTVEEWAETDIYRNHADRFGIRAILCTVDIQLITDIINVISLWREDLYDQFTEEDRQLKQVIAPHMFEACRHNRILHFHQPASGSGVPDAPAIVYGDGLLLDADPGFVGKLRREWPRWRGALLPGPLLEMIMGQESNIYVGRRVVTRAWRNGELLILKIFNKQAGAPLSMRECIVAEKYKAGLTYTQIADALHLSPTTIRSHLQHIYSKLGVTNKTQLVRVLDTGSRRAKFS